MSAEIVVIIVIERVSEKIIGTCGLTEGDDNLIDDVKGFSVEGAVHDDRVPVPQGRIEPFGHPNPISVAEHLAGGSSVAVKPHKLDVILVRPPVLCPSGSEDGFGKWCVGGKAEGSRTLDLTKH